mgnify:CR=1 FL=1
MFIKLFFPFILIFSLIKYTFFLVFLSHFSFRKVSFNKNKIPSRVFIIPQRFLGDIIITSQILDNLIKLNPKIKITILQYNSKIFEKIYKERLGQNLEAIVNYDGFFTTITKILNLGNFDIVIRFASSSARRSIFALMIKSFYKYTIVRTKRIRFKILNDKHIIKQNTNNDNYLQLCNKKINKILGTNFKPSFFLPLIPVDLSNHFQDKSLLDTIKNKDKNKKIIILAPGASFYAKMWSDENFNKLSLYLQEKRFLVFLLEGGLNHEKDLPLKISHNLLIKKELDFDTIFNIIASSDLLISNDSGFAHISVALGVKTIVIPAFMSMDIYGYKFFDNFHTVLPTTDCYPCNIPAINKNCPYYKKDNNGKARCINSISLNSVKNLIDNVL